MLATGKSYQTVREVSRRPESKAAREDKTAEVEAKGMLLSLRLLKAQVLEQLKLKHNCESNRRSKEEEEGRVKSSN
jgi:hypothetical protein